MTFDIRGLTPLLQVYDMPTSFRVYRDVLGFQVVRTSPMLGSDTFHWVLLRLGAAELMLNTAYESNHERPSVRDASRTAAHDDTGLYLSCPDVDMAYIALRDKIVHGKPPVTTSYGMKQMYFHDPDGYTLCFQWVAETDKGDR